MNGICLCVDRFHAGFVGAYGSTWVQTPAIDRMAADGFVFDQFHADSLDVESLYRSCWLGRHALSPDGTVPAVSHSLPALVGQAGLRTVLATDDPAIAALPAAKEFHERILLPEPHTLHPAPSVEAAHLARSFAQVIQRVETLDRPFFLWCHLSSLGRVWDAPWEMRSQYAEADDPDPPTGVDVPNRVLEQGEDPDLLLGIAQAYAGQVSLLDLCVGALTAALAEAGLEQDTAMALVGLRGLALGEHGWVGPDDRLHGEVVHVPLILRLPDAASASDRSQELVQPPDLFPTWLDILARQAAPPTLAAADLMPLIRDDRLPWRDRIGLAGLDGRHAVRTQAWYLTTGPACRLFAKPDDRWEVNDVADRHADIADRLAETLAEYQSQLPSAPIDCLEPLSDILRHGLG